jgi:hypothetical protein
MPPRPPTRTSARTRTEYSLCHSKSGGTMLMTLTRFCMWIALKCHGTHVKILYCTNTHQKVIGNYNAYYAKWTETQEITQQIHCYSRRIACHELLQSWWKPIICSTVQLHSPAFVGPQQNPSPATCHRHCLICCVRVSLPVPVAARITCTAAAAAGFAPGCAGRRCIATVEGGRCNATSKPARTPDPNAARCAPSTALRRLGCSCRRCRRCRCAARMKCFL